MLGEPFRKDVGHLLGRKGNWEGEFSVVARHCRDVLRGVSFSEVGLERLIVGQALTRSDGTSTSIGLSGSPTTETISRIRSDR
jgi:hypothetical protein